MLKKTGIRILAILVILFGLNKVYNFTLYQHDLNEKCAEILNMNNSLPVTDVFYFGESSNITYSLSDSSKSSISDLTSTFFKELRFTNINKYATHAGIYRHWLNKLDLTEHKPSAIIITLNLRSFDAGWINSKLETQLQESIVLTKPYPNLLNRFLLSLQAFDNKTEKQREAEVMEEWKRVKLQFPFDFPYSTVNAWDNGMANGGHLKPDSSWDMDKIVLACHYIKGFAFNLNDENPRVKDFDAIYDWCNKNKISLYLNLMAENLEYADSLVGKELVFLMRENRDFLVNRYNKTNCKVIDNLELVKGKEFVDQNWTSEHYSIYGRMRIAKNLAGTLKTQFINKYKEAY